MAMLSTKLGTAISTLLLVATSLLSHAASEVMALKDSSGNVLTVRLITWDGTNLMLTRESDKNLQPSTRPAG